MKTLRQFAARPETMPTTAAWNLADLSEARGRQELFTRQSPQRLKVLREHALIESAVSSNRIEGVSIDRKRVGTVLFGRQLLRDRNEEEVRGYREALQWIHESHAEIRLTQKTIRDLHRQIRGEIWDAGRYKQADSNIIERFADGRTRLRFETVPAVDTRPFMGQLVQAARRCLREKWVHPLIAVAAFNLDFLCVHPFRDGNGRVSRLLLLLQLYHQGYWVGRYVSLERQIEQNKQRYYETLAQSSRGWHEGAHDPWPYVNYLLFILKAAYREFEARAGEAPSPRGAKTQRVEEAVKAMRGAFRLADLKRVCLGVSGDMVRRVLRNLRKAGQVECHGRGLGAVWRRRGNVPKKG